MKEKEKLDKEVIDKVIEIIERNKNSDGYFICNIINEISNFEIEQQFFKLQSKVPQEFRDTTDSKDWNSRGAWWHYNTNNLTNEETNQLKINYLKWLKTTLKD